MLDPLAVAGGRRKQLQALEEQKAIIYVPHGFPLAGPKRIRSKWLDDCSSSGTEVKSRLVALRWRTETETIAPRVLQC